MHIFDDARTTVLQWIAGRAGQSLPAAAWQGASFELEDVGAQRTAAVAIDRPRYWTSRLDDADKAVAQRTWTVEAAIAQEESGSALFGARLQCVVRGEYVAFERSVPRFVRDIVRLYHAELDDRRISEAPWFVDSDDDVDELVALLADPRRRSDVIVIALPEDSRDASEALVSPYDIALKTIGAAHVVVISGRGSYALTDRVGKEFSVFRQAVRTYRPSFNLSIDEPFSHPLGLPDRIVNWPNGGAEAYSKLLISQALIRSVASQNTEVDLPPFTAARRIAAELEIAKARQSGKTDTELLQQADNEITALRKALDEDRRTYEGVQKLTEEERDQARAEAQQVKATNFNLRARVADLEARLATATGGHRQTHIPAGLEDFEVWCQTHLSGTVEIHNRALQGIKKSRYSDAPFIYKALLLLRDYYVATKLEGGRENFEAYQQACASLGLEEQQTFSGDRWGEEGETYVVRYGGKPRLLERHLKKGNSRDERFCFRLYFFWDADEELVVVGWLPSHLDTRIT